MIHSIKKRDTLKYDYTLQINQTCNRFTINSNKKTSAEEIKKLTLETAPLKRGVRTVIARVSFAFNMPRQV